MREHLNRAQGFKHHSVFAIFATILLLCLFLSASGVLAQGRTANAGSALHESERAAQVRSLNNSVLEMHGQAQENASAAASLRGQVAVVLAQRSAAMQALIEEDPHAALTFAFSPELLLDLASKFPESVALLEAHGTWQGTAEVSVSDDLAHKTSKTMVNLQSGNRKFGIHFDGREPAALQSGDQLTVSGVLAGTTLAAENGTSQVTSVPGAACSTTGDQKTAVVLANLPGSPLPATVTPQAVQSLFFGTSAQSVDGYLRESSYGLTSASGDVFGPFTLTGSYASCSTSQLETDAIALATAAGANFQNYSRVVVVFADTIGCGWSGLATVGCSTLSLPTGSVAASSAFLSANYANVQVATHELGHNLGLRHAQSRDFGSEALGSLGAAGTLYEYGNEFSTMGNWTPGQYAAPHKAEVLGWLAAGSDYQMVQNSGSFTLAPLESGAGSLKALKVQRGTGNAGYYLWIEYRQPIGNYDTTYYTSQPYSGATVNYEDPTTGAYSQLLDFTPESDISNGEGSDFGDPALLPGKTWQDPYSDLSLSVTGSTPTGLSVAVSYGGAAACTHVNPTVTLTPLDPSIYAGQSAGYSVSLTNNDSPACPLSTFSLGSTEPSGWSTSFQQSTVTLAPGETSSFSMSKGSPSSALPGTYGVNMSATDSTLGQSATANATVVAAATLSATISVAGSSFTRPGAVPITAMVTSGGAPLSGATVTFTLTAPNGSSSTQNATTSSTGTASWNYKLSSRSASGSYTVVAKAKLTSGGKKSAATQTVASNTITFTVQ
jgi:M6 family metalloprotease-like protein